MLGKSYNKMHKEVKAYKSLNAEEKKEADKLLKEIEKYKQEMSRITRRAIVGGIGVGALAIGGMLYLDWLGFPPYFGLIFMNAVFISNMVYVLNYHKKENKKEYNELLKLCEVPKRKYD